MSRAEEGGRLFYRRTGAGREDRDGSSHRGRRGADEHPAESAGESFRRVRAARKEVVGAARRDRRQDRETERTADLLAGVDQTAREVGIRTRGAVHRGMGRRDEGADEHTAGTQAGDRGRDDSGDEEYGEVAAGDVADAEDGQLGEATRLIERTSIGSRCAEAISGR